MSNKEIKNHQYVVAQAFKQGKQIQSSPKGQNSWKDIPADVKIIIWDWKDKDYRIKDKP